MNNFAFFYGVTFWVVYLIICVIIGIFTSWLADNKGYENRGTWFILGFFFGFLGLFALGFATNKKYESLLLAKDTISFGSGDAVSVITKNSNKVKICPKCGARVSIVANSCGSCGASL